ncbi:MAG TPA: CapA family protein [Spirochaetia bacterium]|nr:CapA family protein [Spirochaetia bacterium]
MPRIVVVILALAVGSLSAFSLPLFVQASDDLWPEWIRLTDSFPLPPGIEVFHVQPGTSPSGSLIVLSLGDTGKVVGTMPMVPTSRLGEERRSATQGDVSRGKVQLLPLCSVSLPTVALPLDGLFPDQAGYPLSRKVMLALDTPDPLLQAWYTSLEAPADPGAGAARAIAWIEAVGDIMPARGVDEELLAGGGLERVFGDTLALLRGSDLLLGNLESSTATRGQPQDKSYTFRFRGEAVRKLREAGFSYLSLANNHTFDFGADGFLQTLDTLSRWGITTSGAGSNEEEASHPAVDRIGSQEIRILSFGAFPVDRTGFDGRVSERAGSAKPGILWLDEEGLAEAARAFAVTNGGAPVFTIAFVHGGEEWRTTPTADQQRLYRALVQSGANLVLGAHPHVLEGMEAVDGGLIAYSLGNFLFPGMEGTPGGQDSVILRLGIFQGKIRYLQASSVRLRGRTVRLAADDSAWKTLMSRTRALATTVTSGD